MMPLVYDLEIWHKCLGPNTEWRPPNIDLAWPMATEILDWGKRRFSVFRQNGGQNYFRFEFRPQISTLRTRFPYMKWIFRRLSASISEFKRLTISAFGLGALADQATIWRFLPSCRTRNFATVSAMQTKLGTIVVIIWWYHTLKAGLEYLVYALRYSWLNMDPDAYFRLDFLTRLPWEKYDALGLRPRNLARMFRSNN